LKLTLGLSIQRCARPTKGEKVVPKLWKLVGQKAKVVPAETRYQLVLARLIEVGYLSSFHCLESEIKVWLVAMIVCISL
jgi:hypothetical protein